MNDPLFIFYEEPDPDRWFPGDRVPRRLIRRILRGRPQPGGVMRWFLNLRTGLELAGIPHRVNDYRGLRNSPGAWAHVVGKPHVVTLIPPGHPIVYGPGVAAHPLENDFWSRAEIRLILLSCDWFKAMYDRDLPVKIPSAVWPAGVDTREWHPPSTPPASREILIYDKIRWERERLVPELLKPVLETVAKNCVTVHHLRYGAYREEEYRQLLTRVSAMVFLCEHETQGFAYLQALACGVPVLAWDRGGFWQDPSLYPHRVQFAPVTSVPYFDERCGRRFQDAPGFQEVWPQFLAELNSGQYRPRDYVTSHFDLAGQARTYAALCRSAAA